MDQKMEFVNRILNKTILLAGCSFTWVPRIRNTQRRAYRNRSPFGIDKILLFILSFIPKWESPMRIRGRCWPFVSINRKFIVCSGKRINLTFHFVAAKRRAVCISKWFNFIIIFIKMADENYGNNLNFSFEFNHRNDQFFNKLLLFQSDNNLRRLKFIEACAYYITIRKIPVEELKLTSELAGFISKKLNQAKIINDIGLFKFSKYLSDCMVEQC